MKPDGPSSSEVIFSAPHAEAINDKRPETYATFAHTLFRRAIERRGITKRYPSATVGQHVDANPDEKLLHTRPAANDPAAVHRWVGRMVDIPRNPKRHNLHFDVFNRLVPFNEPLRYRMSELTKRSSSFFTAASRAPQEHRRRTAPTPKTKSITMKRT
jgi:hypothetical protein